MQPHTAINLRERKSNRLKDFIVMAGPLGVSDLFVFNQSSNTGNISLRVGKMPRGPILQFRINNYSLAKDVRRILKHPKSVGKDSSEFLSPPLLVLNGFSNKVNELDNHERLLITVFQNMFPPIQAQSTKVSSIKRVLMINKNSSGEIDLRHYAINTKLVEETRGIKKLINSHHNLKKNLPNMAKINDVSEMVLDPYAVGGITSDSEVEDDEIVEVKQDDEKLVKKTPDEEIAPTKKRAIKLTELGPRINMTLMKIEEGLTGSSKTLYHKVVTKTDLEQKALAKKHERRQQLKAERRAQQKANVQIKLDRKKAKKERKLARKNGEIDEGDQSNDQVSLDESDSDAPVINPEDYENDSDLYSDVESQ
jgi:ribosome biogenesis protein SSF1/2